MANFYKGSEIKFKIELEAEGFDMDRDDFDIEVASPRGSVKGHKNASQGEDNAVVIFKENDDWFAIVDTTELPTGEYRVIGTAYIPDVHATGAVRTDIGVAKLGLLIEP